MTSEPAPRIGHRGATAYVRFRSGSLLWVAVLAVCAVALIQGAWAIAVAAAACVLLAAAPLGWGAVSGLAFPGRLLDGLVGFNACALLLGEMGGFYVTVAWWDILLHLVSSAVLAVLGMALGMIATDGSPGRIGARMLAILAFGFAVMIGAAWELLEFTLDATLGTNTQRSGLPDTMGDMAVNVAGATWGAIAAHAHVVRGARWPLGGLLGEFMDLNPQHYPWRPHARHGPR